MSNHTAPLTSTRHAMLVLMATDTFTWPGAKSSRPEWAVREGLCAWIKAYAQGLCAFCGEASDALEIGHIVSGGNGNARYGWVRGNLAACCRTCNDVDKLNGEIVSFESIVRPDLVPTDWPKRSLWASFKDEEEAMREIERNRKRALRGM